MRFLIPAQTIAEYRHNKMPVYETWMAIGVGVAAVGTAGSLGMQALNASKAGHTPSYNPQQSLATQAMQFGQMAPQEVQFQNQLFGQESPQALGFGTQSYNQAAQQGLQFAKQGTRANIANQNLVTPGSSAQRELALNQLNQYIQGNVPTDVQQNINRQVAQNLGGGFNLFSGGGQAPQNFARNLGQTSLGLSQFGLSAAPTWQQLANQMVVSPTAGLEAGLQATGMGGSLAQGTAANALNLVSTSAGIGNQMAESQYQSQMNQYGAQQAANQGMVQGLQGLGSAGLGIANAGTMANYYGNLSSPSQGTSAYSNQFGLDQMSSGGFYETPAAVQAAFGQGAIPAYYSGGGQSGYYNQGFTQ